METQTYWVKKLNDFVTIYLYYGFVKSKNLTDYSYILDISFCIKTKSNYYE